MENRIKTQRQIVTQPMDLSQSTSKGLEPVIFDDVTFHGNLNGEFVISGGQMIKDGGEAQIYYCRKKGINKKFVAKIYTSISPSTTQDRKRDPIINFLLKHRNNPSSHIMSLEDYGILHVHDGKYENQPHYIEIYPYCAGGDLKSSKKIPYTTLVEKVIPAVNIALNQMHKENLIHRDIKPENLYWYNNDIILGDFGITTQSSQNLITHTTQQRGTLGYSAPELLAGAAVLKSDYYSFGQTIATLYMGKHMYQLQLSWSDSANERRVILDHMMKEKIFLDIEDAHKWFEVLITGLLKYSPSERFGFSEVNRWLSKDKSLKVSRIGLKAPSQEGDYERPFNFEGILCRNDDELIKSLLDNWERAKKYLYRGTLKDFFGRENQALSIIADEIVDYKVPDYEDKGLSMFLHHLSKGNGIYWDGKSYSTYGEISDEINHSGVTENEGLIGLIKSGVLSWRLINTYEKNKDYTNNIEILRTLEAVANQYPVIGYYLAKFMLATDETNNHYYECRTIDNLFQKIFKDKNCFYNYGLRFLNDEEFLGFLIYLGYSTQVLNIMESLNKGKILDGMSKLFFFFEEYTTSENKTLIRKAYVEYGPKSYLIWLKRNLSIYEYNGSSADNIRNQILNALINPEEPLLNIEEEFKTLEHLLNEFLNLFQNNIHLAYMGMNMGKDVDGIISKNTDGFFIADFFGKNVPIGFKKYLGLTI